MANDPIRFRFTGPAVDAHTMDVVHLAPSLMALGEICKLADRKFNQDRAAVKVLVQVDREHQCFELSLNVVQPLLREIQGLVFDRNISTAKEILEWIGLIDGPAIGIGLSFLRLLAWIRGRKLENSTITEKDGNRIVEIRVEGDNNTVIVAHPIWDLAQDKNAVDNSQKLLSPLLEEGYEGVEFQDGTKIQKFTKEDARGIAGTAGTVIEDVTEETSQELMIWITVYSPVYDQNAERWRFRLGGHIEYFDISKTSIAQDAIKRGGALMNDEYKVKAKLVQSRTQSGRISNRYSIVSIEDFKPAEIHPQGKLFENGDR